MKIFVDEDIEERYAQGLYDCVNSVLSSPDKTLKVKYEIEKWWKINNESNKN